MAIIISGALLRTSMLLLVGFYYAPLVMALGQKQIISFENAKGSFPLAAEGLATAIRVDAQDWPGVIRAAKDLVLDFQRSTGHKLPLTFNDSLTSNGSQISIIIGTIGKSRIIDSLVSRKILNVSSVLGKWESFQTQLIRNPDVDVDDNNALVIAGSDKRGSIFGIYTLSEQLGISPWYWWADVAVSSIRSEVYALDVVRVQGPPSVKYRGIFLNDEQPALTNWVNANYPHGKYGPGYNSEFYSRVFELLLRLKANFLWPAMWDSMFGVDDSENQETADTYGIVMSTSHTEPLQRSTKEWNIFGNGTWDWRTNSEAIHDFWVEGVERARRFENCFTMGMRGNGDNVLSEDVVTGLLESIVVDQRKTLKNVLGVEDLRTVPQVWCLYKDIQAYYEAGMRVPEDVTLLWTDDNWGNIRRLPTSNERNRTGGAGVYYHFDYVGDPRDYKWINTIQLQRVWEQMHLAYQRNARQIWVVNVGDLKPLELPIDYFLGMAYDFDQWGSINNALSYETAWAARDFGQQFAVEIAEIIDTYGMYAARRKYELLDSTTYSIIHYREAETVLDDWKNLLERAETMYRMIPDASKPAFFQLVLHPVKAGYIVHDIYVSAAKNNLYANQRRNSANAWANYVLKRFEDDNRLTEEYHTLLNGKWKGMMSQTHIGYQYWQQPMRNTLPPLAWVQLSETSLAGSLGVSVESSNGSIPGDDLHNSASYGNNTLVLPQLDPYSPFKSRLIDVFSKGTEAFNFTVKPHNSWVKVTPSTGFIDPRNPIMNQDIRVEVSVDWDAAPNGYNIAFIDIFSSPASYGNFGAPSVNLPIHKPTLPPFNNSFIESNKQISIEASHFSHAPTNPGDKPHYKVITNYGRTLSGVTLFPVLAKTQTPPLSPHLEYKIYTFTQPPNSTLNITLYLGVGLNTYPSRPLKYGISLDNIAPQIIRFVPDAKPMDMPKGWDKSVSEAVWKSTTSHRVVGTGAHVVRIWAVEPGVVFQKVVVDLGGVRGCYLGPPESLRV